MAEVSNQVFVAEIMIAATQKTVGTKYSRMDQVKLVEDSL